MKEKYDQNSGSAERVGIPTDIIKDHCILYWKNNKLKGSRSVGKNELEAL